MLGQSCVSVSKKILTRFKRLAKKVILQQNLANVFVCFSEGLWGWEKVNPAMPLFPSQDRASDLLSPQKVISMCYACRSEQVYNLLFNCIYSSGRQWERWIIYNVPALCYVLHMHFLNLILKINPHYWCYYCTHFKVEENEA